MTGDLRTLAFSAAKWTAASMLVRAGFAVLQLFVLARLLAPRDFGLLAMALAVLNLVLIIADLGLSSAIIHYQDISERQRSSLYWLNILSGLALTLLLVVASPAIAAFYREPALVPVLMLSSCVFAVSAPGQQFRALAEKQLRFAALARIEIAAAILGFGLTIVTAFLGFGVYAVVLGTLLTGLAGSIMAWRWLAGGWRPLLVLDFSGMSRFIRYGAQVISVNLASSLGLQGDVIVAGRLFPSLQLGYYFPAREMSMRVMMVINPIVTRIGFPLIAHVQADRQRAAAIYRQTMLMTSSVNFPLYGALALFAPQIVELFLGPGWEPSTPLLRAVAIWCAVRSVGNPVGSLLMGLGETRRAIVSATLVSLLVLLVAAVGGMLYGTVGVPYALAVLYALLVVPFWLLLVRPSCGLGFADYHMQLVRPAACTLLAVLAGWMASAPVGGSIAQLLAGGTAGTLVYVGASCWLNRDWVTAMMHLLGHRREARA